MSIGMTRSYMPIGTMARSEPLVLVVNAKRLRGDKADVNTLTVENLFAPGVSQPKNSRSRPSRRQVTW